MPLLYKKNLEFNSKEERTIKEEKPRSKMLNYEYQDTSKFQKHKKQMYKTLSLILAAFYRNYMLDFN